MYIVVDKVCKGFEEYNSCIQIYRAVYKVFIGVYKVCRGGCEEYCRL